MDLLPDTATARVPFLLRALDARGRPVRLSGHALSHGSTGLQELLGRAYATVRPEAAGESITISFLEESPARLHLEFLVMDRHRRGRWWRGRNRGRCEQVQTALMAAALVVAAAVEAVGAVSAARAARWSDGDGSGFVELVLDGLPAVRVPGIVREWLADGTVLGQLRATLSLFVHDDVDRLIIGKDPETPGRYQETVVTRSPALVRFLEGGPLEPLHGAGPQPA